MRTFSALLVVAVVTNGANAQTRSAQQPTRRDAPAERSYWRLSSDTVFVAYEVRSPSSPVRFERRRLVQRVGLQHVLRLGLPESPWRLVSSLALRLDQEFGQVCRRRDDYCLAETNPGARRDFQVLVDKSRIDATQVWVELRKLDGLLSVRLGRQLQYDATGMVRIDGGAVTLRPLPWLDAQIYAGGQATGTGLLSQYGFETQGAIRIDVADDVEPERVSFVAPPSQPWVVGGNLGLGATKWLRARAAFREVRDADGLVARRLAGTMVSHPASWLELRAQGSWDPTDWTLVDALAQLSFPAEAFATHLRLEHHEPRFDLGTIWAYFNVAPMTELQLIEQWDVSETWSVGAAAKGRRIAARAATSHEIGADASIRYRRSGWVASWRGWLWAGDLGTSTAVFMNLSKRLRAWAEIYARASVWHFDHPLRPDLYGTSVSGAIGARVKLSDLATVRGEVEYAHSRLVGHRFRMLASLMLRAWR